MSFLEIVLLGIVQGLTEFLPVSSSGHLVVFEALLGVSESETTVNVALHIGTLVAILGLYRQRVFRLLGEDFRVVPLLIVGTLPAAVIGVLIKKTNEHLLESPLLAGWMLLVTAAVLLYSGRLRPGDLDYRKLTYRQALAIGFAQAFALLPGISRSGSTIVAGMALGLKREDAATFSFLLAIPAILGAGVLESLDVITGEKSSAAISPLYLLVGATVAMLVGVLALVWLLRWLKGGKLVWFAWWCAPMGVGVIIWQLMAGQS